MVMIHYYRRCQPIVINSIREQIVKYSEDLKQRSINHGSWVPTTEAHRKWFIENHLELCLEFPDPTL